MLVSNASAEYTYSSARVDTFYFGPGDVALLGDNWSYDSGATVGTIENNSPSTGQTILIRLPGPKAKSTHVIEDLIVDVATSGGGGAQEWTWRLLGRKPDGSSSLSVVVATRTITGAQARSPWDVLNTATASLNAGESLWLEGVIGGTLGSAPNFVFYSGSVTFNTINGPHERA
jgi:hypothetical protein